MASATRSRTFLVAAWWTSDTALGCDGSSLSFVSPALRPAYCLSAISQSVPAAVLPAAHQLDSTSSARLGFASSVLLRGLISGHHRGSLLYRAFCCVFASAACCRPSSRILHSIIVAHALITLFLSSRAWI
eukprot:gb/GEZN01005322.1/.p2 GENE.gb/GEZN01005322.1/~~gb/GEZN01005322.1/.p2  ORF type:complete len:131 (+),score=7.38 gb/GEZN01005322.1/:1118-1510(+)